MARDNALAIGAGHSFILFLRDCFPINVLNAIKNIQEVCTIYCATANPAEVVIAGLAQGRGIMGVIDGEKPKGVEGPEGIAWRTGLLRRFGTREGRTRCTRGIYCSIPELVGAVHDYLQDT